MKLVSKLSIAAPSVLLASSAFALAPSVTPDLEIYMSGASAQDNFIEALFTDLCVSGSLDIYRDGGVGKAHRAFFCELDASQVPGMSSNQNVLFHKRSAGGSGQGVQPVADEALIAAMNIDNGNCTNTSGNEWSCTISNPGDLSDAVSDAGVSDVEPGLFVSPNVPSGFSAVTVAQLNKLIVKPAAALSFGTPVSLNLRNALQEAEFGIGDACVGSDTEACMPSLSSNQVASVMTGKVGAWNKFFVGSDSLNSAAVVSAPVADSKVQICRRVEGSGTQATFNAVQLNVPCSAGAVPPAKISSGFFGPIVTLNSGSGDVETCLENAHAAGKWAIGVQSTEKNASASKDYRFIKVDGVAPTIENVANGTHKHWVEQTFQWRTAANNGPTGDKLAILETIANDASKPATVAAINASKAAHPFGQAGYLALTTNGHTATVPFNIANPVNPYSKSTTGSVNNCRVPVVNGAGFTVPPSELY